MLCLFNTLERVFTRLISRTRPRASQLRIGQHACELEHAAGWVHKWPDWRARYCPHSQRGSCQSATLYMTAPAMCSMCSRLRQCCCRHTALRNSAHGSSVRPGGGHICSCTYACRTSLHADAYGTLHAHTCRTLHATVPGGLTLPTSGCACDSMHSPIGGHAPGCGVPQPR